MNREVVSGDGVGAAIGLRLQRRTRPVPGRVHDAPDASATDTTMRSRRRSIGLHKTEVVRRRGPWRHLEAVELATLEWVEWFNHRRPFEPIGDVTPVEKEETYDQDQEWAKVA